jgi:predicted nucleic acid-binding protein
MPAEPALVDTNVLVYALYQDSPQYAASQALVNRAQKSGANLFIAAQSLAEFYATVTNARRVTDPKKPEEALEAIEALLAIPGLSLLPQPPDVVNRWCELLRQHPVLGGDVFDLQLIAKMLASGIRKLYTFNAADFLPFTQIEVIVPAP